MLIWFWAFAKPTGREPVLCATSTDSPSQGRVQVFF
jgi:hypothetical protein